MEERGGEWGKREKERRGIVERRGREEMYLRFR